jgi:D-alanine-D-alanine ligase
MSRKMNITVLVDPDIIPGDDPDLRHQPEEPITEYHVVEALRTLGHQVSVLENSDDPRIIVNTVTEQKPDLVFNLTEQFGGDRRLDKNIAALLELLEVPFTGSSATGLLLSRDKRLCKQLLSLHKIRVPAFVSLPRDRNVRIPKSIRYPLVVKPAFEDSSEGIANASLVYDQESLLERAQFIHERWEQPVIAEEYVEGRELYVSILGNKRLTVLPIRECFFQHENPDAPLLLTYRVKWNAEYRQKWNIEFGFADLDSKTFDNISRICKRVYRALHMQDYGRIDVRLTPENKLVVLEANPNPDIAYGEEVAEAAEKASISYEQFIDRILHHALRRYA